MGLGTSRRIRQILRKWGITSMTVQARPCWCCWCWYFSLLVVVCGVSGLMCGVVRCGVVVVLGLRGPATPTTPRPTPLRSIHTSHHLTSLPHNHRRKPSPLHHTPHPPPPHPTPQPQTEIIPEEVARLPLPPGTSYRCLSEDVDDSDDDHEHGEENELIRAMLPSVSIGTMSLSSAHHHRHHHHHTEGEEEGGEAPPPAALQSGVPSTVKEEGSSSKAAEGAEYEYRMVRTATNTISAETPSHREQQAHAHAHHYGHHHRRKNRTFHDLGSTQEAEAAAKGEL